MEAYLGYSPGALLRPEPVRTASRRPTGRVLKVQHPITSFPEVPDKEDDCLVTEHLFSFLNGRKDRASQQVKLKPKALAFQSLTASPQGHSLAMVTKQRSANPQHLLNNRGVIVLLKALGIVIAVLLMGIFIYWISGWSVGDKVSGKVGEQLQAPLQRLAKVEERTDRIPGIENTQNFIQQKVIELDIKFDLFFGERRIDAKTSENILGRAVDRAITTQNPVERRVALQFAHGIVDKATNAKTILNYKKINQFGSDLLEQNHQDFNDYDPEFEAIIEGLAAQRVLINPAPKIPPDDKPKPDDKEAPKYIVDQEVRVDAVLFEDVTFINCTIIYGQGWIGLQDVRFINCKFDVSPIDKGRELYESLFGSVERIPTISVRTPAPLPNEIKDP